MANIFNAYEAYSQHIINTDPTLSTYEKEMKEKKRYVKDLVLSANIFTILTHPVKLIRTRQELKRINTIREKYYELKKSPLVEHFVEEDGELEHDLRSAAEYFKPERMKQYAKKNPVYREQDKKLLKRK